MKLGSVLNQKQRTRVNFRSWLKEFYIEGRQYELRIIRIFQPTRFPNYTLILLDTEHAIEVSRTLKPETAKELLKEFKFSNKRPTPGTLYLVIDKTGEAEIIHTPEQNFEYQVDGFGWKLVDKTQQAEFDDDIPF